MSTTEKRPRPEKVEEVEILRGILERSQGAIIADYRGLNVKALNTLRKRLRETDGSVRIIKNTLVKRAAVGLPMEKLVADLEGPTALAYTETDAVGAAKVIAGFVKEFKILKVKGGIAEGHMMDFAGLQTLATLPPRQVLIGQVVGGLQSPVSSFVNTMQRLYADFVYTLQGVADKK